LIDAQTPPYTPSQAEIKQAATEYEHSITQRPQSTIDQKF